MAFIPSFMDVFYFLKSVQGSNTCMHTHSNMMPRQVYVLVIWWNRSNNSAFSCDLKKNF